MRRKLLLTLIAFVLLCAGSLVAYALTRPLALNTALGYYVAHTEMEADACQSEGLLVDGTYNPYSIQPLPDGFLIFYAVDCSVPGQPTRTWLARHKYVVTGFRWVGTSAGRSSQPPPPPSGTLVTYDVDVGYHQAQPYSFVNGQVLTTTVTAVEVTFANGEIKRTTLNDGYFAALTLPGVMACDLQLLDAHGSVIQRYDLALPPPIPANFGTCPP